MTGTDPAPHPLDHIEPLKAYEWYLAERAALVAAGKAREDSLIATIIQLSSAALLLVPGLFLTADSLMPPVMEGKLLYLGISCFGLALFAALTEQYLSAKAYARQLDVIEAYYFNKGIQTYDPASSSSVRIANNLTLGLFCTAVLLTCLGLTQVR